MARLPHIRQPERQSAMAAPVPAPTRTMAELPPSTGYLQGEIERLPVAGPILGDEEFPILQGGQAKRGSTRSLIKRIREEANDVAENAAKLAVEGGGSGRHSLVRSFNRARSLSSLDGSETVGIVREGEFFRVPMSLLLGSGGGGDADTLGGQLPAYFLDWGNFTGVPTTFTPSPHTHPISDVTGLQTALDAKAALASPALTGNPTAPTQAAGNNSTRIATTAYTDAAIAALIASAPGVLDTLDEIAAALGDDPNFAATMTAALAGKLAKASNLSDLANAATARANLGVAIGTDVAAQSHVGSGGSAHAAVVAGGAAGFMTGTDKTKLDGIASGATANSSDATLLNRANHTGAQAISTVSGLQSALDAKVAGAASATDNAVARFDATTGKIIQNSGVIIDDSNNITGAASFTGGTSGAGGSNALKIAGGIHGGQSGGGYARLGYNIRFTGTANSYQYDLSDVSVAIEYGKANGSFGGLQVYTASPGTAGDAITFTAGPYITNGGTSWTTPSDSRLKENIKPITVLDRIEKFRAVTFDWKQSGKHDCGVIAQEVLEVFPEIVNTEGDYLGVDYPKLAALAMQAVKDAMQVINELTARVQKLEANS